MLSLKLCTRFDNVDFCSGGGPLVRGRDAGGGVVVRRRDRVSGVLTTISWFGICARAGGVLESCSCFSDDCILMWLGDVKGLGGWVIITCIGCFDDEM